MTPNILRKTAEFLAKNVTSEMWNKSKNVFLKQLKLNDMQLGNELAKALENKAFAPSMTGDDWIKVSKLVNSGPLYHAVAAILSAPERKKHFPEISHKFEETTTANVARYPVPMGLLRRRDSRKAKFKKGALSEDFKSSAKKFLSQGVEQTEIDSYFEDFKKLKDGSKIKDPSQKDIDIWAKGTWEEFKTFVDSLKTKQTKTQAKKIAKTEGAELVAENEGWYVYRITSHKACMMYGSNTKWCITEPDGKHWKDYNNNSNFYFLISKIERDDNWNKIAVQVEPNGEVYWDEIDEKHTSLPARLKIPRFTREVPEEKIEVNGEWMTLDDFSNSHGLKVGGGLYLSDTKIKSLPNGLEVSGSLYLGGTTITSLPNGLEVGGDLSLAYTKIKSLPKDLKVGGYLDLYGTPIESLPNGLRVGIYIFVDDPEKIQCSDELRKKVKKY